MGPSAARRRSGSSRRRSAARWPKRSASGGVTWIPCFALDRTQRILYELHLAQREKLLPDRLPIYCPSPTAKEVTALYRGHRRNGWFSPAIAADADAFSPREVRRTSPGKTAAAPVHHHQHRRHLVAPWMRRLLGTLLPEPSTNIVLVGYQTAGSAGELLLHGATKLDIDGQPVPVRAKVQCVLVFLRPCRRLAKLTRGCANVAKQATVILIHGDREELAARAEQLRRQGRRQVIIARPGETIGLE